MKIKYYHIVRYLVICGNIIKAIKELFSSVSNLQNKYNFELEFQRVDQRKGVKWLIHGTKHHKDNQLQSLGLHCRIFPKSVKRGTLYMYIPVILYENNRGEILWKTPQRTRPSLSLARTLTSPLIWWLYMSPLRSNIHIICQSNVICWKLGIKYSLYMTERFDHDPGFHQIFYL